MDEELEPETSEHRSGLSFTLPEPLLIEATRQMSELPSLEIAGLIIENGVSIDPGLGIEIETEGQTGNLGMCGLVPHALAFRILEFHADENQNITDDFAEFERGRLLTVLLSHDGLKFGRVKIWEPRPEDLEILGEPFGTFLLRASRNDEMKILRNGVEMARRNPVKPGRYFQRLVMVDERPNGQTVQRIKYFGINLKANRIQITEVIDDRLYARQVITVDSIG